MTATRKLTYLLTLTLPIASCSFGDKTKDHAAEGPEVYQNEAAALRESSILAVLDGTKVRLSIPLEKTMSDTLTGQIKIRLLDVREVDTEVLAKVEQSVRQTKERETHVVELTGLPELTRPEAAGVVIDWGVDLEPGLLHGKRSLYAALGKLEVQLIGTTEVPQGGSSPLRIIVRDPNSLVVSNDAAVSGTLKTEDHTYNLFAGKTDARGEMTVDLQMPANVSDGQLRVDVEFNGAQSWTETSIRSIAEEKLHLSTDKTIYKPGQNIHLRVLALHSTNKTPLAEREVVFEATDGKGNKVFKRRTTTDRFGVAAMDVPTATDVNEGDWTFRALVDNMKIQRKIPVMRYNLPKMKVELTAEQEFVQVGDIVSGKVQVRYLFGAPVVAAQVQVIAKNRDGNVLDNATGQSNADGEFSFDVEVPDLSGAALDNGDEALVLEAQVVDSAQQTEQGALSLPLVRHPIVVKVLSETGSLLQDVENILYLIVTDAVGRPLVSTVKVEGLSARTELQTDAEGIAILRFNTTAEELTLDVTAIDGAGRTASRDLELKVSNDHHVLVRTDKAVYDVGDVALVRLYGPEGTTRFFVDVFKGATGVKTQSIDARSGSAEIRLPIEEGMKGVLIIDAFALLGAGEAARGAQRILVDPKDKLDVALVPNRETFVPGDSAEVTISVQNAAGAPQVAALGVSVVDEGVFALGGEADDDLRSHFNLDPRVLPATVEVLGRTPASLFEGAGLAREQSARLLFAAANDLEGPGLEYNSVREELPEVVKQLQSALQATALKVFKTIVRDLERGAITRDEITVELISEMRWQLDPFGQYFKVETQDDQMWIRIISAGPDEQHETADDVSLTTYYHWITYVDEEDLTTDYFQDRGHGRGGGFGDDFDAANAPMPGAEANEGLAGTPADGSKQSSGGGEKARVRSDFRETIYANPVVITDTSGRATLSFPVADSITTWRMTAHGSTADGKLGTAKANFRTFQEFFVDFDVPTYLTRNDEIEVPAVVYNYLSSPQTVTVTLEDADFIEILSSATQSITLNPSEVRQVKFRLRVVKAGEHELLLRATAGGIGDAIARFAQVTPDGTKEEQTFSDKINGTRNHIITVPSDSIENGTKVEVVLTPGFAGEAVQGTEAIMKEPSGCFEQTTSSAWPNTLVTTYLDVTGQMTPELEEKAIGTVTRGYQKLLTFESPTGGFNWWGDNDPGNRILSAIMLWHLKDLEQVIEVDDAVRTRTLEWLLDQQEGDGHWPSGDALHSGNEVLGTSDARTTSFIVWALAHTGWADSAVSRGTGWLKSNLPPQDDLYANALAANALAFAEPTAAATNQLFSRLDTLKEAAGEGKVKWPTEQPSWTGAGGDVAAIETTSLVAYGLMEADAYPENTAGALRFLVSNKDSVGTWYNTQATMNSLRALLKAASPRGTEADGDLTVTVNGVTLPTVTITVEDGDVYRSIDITDHVQTGNNDVQVAFSGNGEITYRLTRRAYRDRQPPQNSDQLAFVVAYDDLQPQVGAPVQVNASATYVGPGRRDQVMVRIGRAPGMVPNTDDLERLKAEGKVERYEVRESDVTFYVMNLQSNVARDLAFRLTPTLAVTAEAPASSMYVYYESDIRTETAPTLFNVTAP